MYDMPLCSASAELKSSDYLARVDAIRQLFAASGNALTIDAFEGVVTVRVYADCIDASSRHVHPQTALLPLYWAGALFHACIDDVAATAAPRASCSAFLSLYEELSALKDQADRLMHVLAPTSSDGFDRTSVVPLVKFIISRHPGVAIAVVMAAVLMSRQVWPSWPSRRCSRRTTRPQSLSGYSLISIGLHPATVPCNHVVTRVAGPGAAGSPLESCARAAWWRVWTLLSTRLTSMW